MRTGWDRAAIAAVALLLSACSVVNDPDAHLAEPVELVDLCDVVTASWCQAVTGCCPEGAQPIEACEAAVRPEFCAFFSSLFEDPRTGYDPTAAGHAVALLERAGAECSPGFVDWFYLRDLLGSAALGTLARGESCAPGPFDDDPPNFRSLYCRDGLVCRPDAAPSEGWSCLPAPGPGEPCAGLGTFVCAPGSYCPPNGPAPTCQRLREDGEQCGNEYECESFSCVAPTEGERRRCVGGAAVFCDLAGRQ